MSDEGIQVKIKPARMRHFNETLIRLSAAVEVSSRAALEQILAEVQQKAVENAPKREEIAASKSGLYRGMPEQLYAPGLLKNSIGYYITGDQQIRGLNTYGGKFRVSTDISEYPSQGKFGARKSKGTIQGFVGTFVCHRDYINWSDTYSYTVEQDVTQRATGSGWVRKSRMTAYEKAKETVTKEKKISDNAAKFTYGSWIEFNFKPFLRPALYSMIDSGRYKNIIAQTLKRDLRAAAQGKIPGLLGGNV